ncbi:hypothetical protein NQ315_004931 [Exocentrus adspersus]|uniref:Uncharacterized protein n=1 Tax=Exocentrus adspersus TaxID=1586481 RepID=A0AAV8W383_9CUCU|nr:hypothetical protein NQ315_004931 [Exocentrus adspersus]
MIKLVLLSALSVAVTSAALIGRQYPIKPVVLPQQLSLTRQLPTLPPVLASPLPTYHPVPSPAYNTPLGKLIAILRLDSDIAPDGSSYKFAYETENGIAAEETGALGPVGPEGPAIAARGSFQYTSPEGIPVQLSYIADENGFQPVGNVLPTSPPIPEAILRSLEYNAAHPEEDDLGVPLARGRVFNNRLIAAEEVPAIGTSSNLILQLKLKGTRLLGVVFSVLVAAATSALHPSLGALRHVVRQSVVPSSYTPLLSQPLGRHIAILRSDSDISPDGQYHYVYETENGISAQESGGLVGAGPEAGTGASGSFQYTSPEGLPVQVSYVADQNGFQPSGNVLPTPPPIPEAIARSVAYNLAHPQPQDAVLPLARRYYK